MRMPVLASAFMLTIVSASSATDYRGSFETYWRLGAFEDHPAIATIEANSNGTHFQIDSLKVDFTATVPSRPGFGSGALDPIAVSINLFTDSQLLEYIPQSDIATIDPLEFGWDIQYSGVYRDGISFEVVSNDSQVPVGTRSTTTLFDLGQTNQIEVVFDTTVDWSIPSLETPTGISFGVLGKPTQPVILRAVPEITGDYDLDGNVDGMDFLSWQRGESPISLSELELADWQDNYGVTSLTGVQATNVPEPSSLIISLATILLGTLTRSLQKLS